MEKIKKLGIGVKIAIVVVMVVILACAIGAGVAMALNAENQKNIEFYQDHVFDNTRVAGIDISKMTAEEAKDAVNDTISSASAKVTDGSEEMTFTAADADVTEVPLSFFQDIVAAQDSKQWKTACAESTDVKISGVTYDMGKLQEQVVKMDCVSGKDRKEAVDAQLKMEDGEFEIVPGQEGTRVDADLLTDLVLQGITSGIYDASAAEKERSENRNVELDAVDKAKQDLKELRASFVDADKDGWDDNTDVIIANALAEANAKVDEAEEALKKAKEESINVSGTYSGKKVELDLNSAGKSTNSSGENKTIVASNYYEQPIWTGNEEEFQAAQDKARKWLGAEIDYTIDMIPHAAKVDNKVIQDFIVVNQDKIDVELDEDAIKNWLHETCKEYDTVGTTRHYESPTGESMDLSGGHYGWMTDESAEVPKLVASIEAGETVSRDMSYEREAKGPKGGKEWGDFYVDIDRYDQTGRVVSNGEVTYSWRFVSGTNTPSRETQVGFYDIFWKASPHIMRGEINPSTGRPEYETPCDFFSCFNFNGSAVHDATWRGNWSTSAWLYGDGSHGCLNSSYSDAQWFYNNIPYGTPVIVHD